MHLPAHGSNLCALCPSRSSLLPQMVSNDDNLAAPRRHLLLTASYYRCIKNNKIEKARASLMATRFSSEEAEEELQTIIQAVDFERNSKETSSGYAALWKDKSVRKRLLLALGMNAGQQLTGQGSLTTYSTKIYQGVFDDSSTIALINALNATLSILFCLNVTWIVERWGRKVLFIIGGAGQSCLATPFYIVWSLTSPQVWHAVCSS